MGKQSLKDELTYIDDLLKLLEEQLGNIKQKDSRGYKYLKAYTEVINEDKKEIKQRLKKYS